MAQLGELYEAIDNVKKLGLDVTGLLKQVEEKENQVLSDEIIPSIKEVAGMLLQHFRRDIDITIHHKNGRPLSIDFSQPSLSEKKDLGEGMELGEKKELGDKKEEKPKKPVISTVDHFPQYSQKHLFHVKTKSGVHGVGVYDVDRKVFILLKGSIINPNPATSMKRTDKFNEIIKYYCDFIDGQYVLNCDYELSSPSTASSIVLGRSSNGWTDWKDDSGKDLGSVYRR